MSDELCCLMSERIFSEYCLRSVFLAVRFNKVCPLCFYFFFNFEGEVYTRAADFIGLKFQADKKLSD